MKRLLREGALTKYKLATIAERMKKRLFAYRVKEGAYGQRIRLEMRPFF